MTSRKSDQEIIEGLRTQCADNIAQITILEQKVGELSAHITMLNTQLANVDSTTTLLRKLYNRIDGKIMSTINRKGAYKKHIKRTHPVIPIPSLASRSDLLRLAFSYDISEFYAYRKKVHFSHLRPQYRVVAKIYRTTRDSLIRLAKMLHYRRMTDA